MVNAAFWKRIGKGWLIGLLYSLGMGYHPLCAAPLPPVEDTPEEMMQIEVAEDAVSRLNGEVVTPVTEAQQRDALRIPEEDLPARLTPKVYQVILLLRLRSVVRGLLPFL
jgi:hypothetical protein